MTELSMTKNTNAHKKLWATIFLIWTAAFTGVTLVYNRQHLSQWQNAFEPQETHERSYSVDEFTRGVDILPIHSHNDYWRKVPFWDAYKIGVKSVEADIWYYADGKDLPRKLSEDKNFDMNEIYVGHTSKFLNASKTLNSLYLDHIWGLLENSNSYDWSNSSIKNGVFYDDPHETLFLFLDVKRAAAGTFERLPEYLDRFIKKGYLSYYNLEKNIGYSGPLTLILTGGIPEISYIDKNVEKLYTFLDAPLNSFMLVNNNANTTYDSDLEKYQVYSKVASGALEGIISDNPTVFNNTKILDTGDFTEVEMKYLKAGFKPFTENAKAQLFYSRIWELPAWPRYKRDKIWRSLIEAGVGLLNVDDLASASMF
ncbi:hypothetical protein BABINDRAFT_179909 [Babjeviella inositovora NRRL Y-12698]|uniref:Altered inheritance of mitochondria protein 6 n=1 Tax=Babjeviella inositovora NRRL Y-12698 TaxID=984486 RepID=A0A1E3QSB3_9ASCO|nr:uncharacterized protein BABINDRAFT_179909 [Babjeviella inositovora NRRL Y-12698]ODQ80593.1 hypothetical protein BABINDRAFT_179909 [Babjeviella inositovora NRRL Y-12698]